MSAVFLDGDHREEVVVERKYMVDANARIADCRSSRIRGKLKTIELELRVKLQIDCCGRLRMKRGNCGKV